ncbi:MAG: aspartyl beta-hydroxylase [Alphaproteobacteria bacterium]|nr:aspartyl beta-hydroxylase [Alphaproteobacteria bacterium]
MERAVPNDREADLGSDLAARARAAERAGDIGQAEALWAELERAAPQHPFALYRTGRRLVQARDPKAALPLLEAAEAGEATDPDIPLYRGLALVMSGSLEAALDAYDRALARDPYFLMALLSKGSVLDRLGRKRDAALVYRDALKIAPAAVPPFMARPLDHARAAIAEDARAFGAYLRAAVAAERARFPGADFARFDATLAIYAGEAERPQTDEPYPHAPTLLYVPDVPAWPFYERSYFPWLDAVEAQTDAIRDEFFGVFEGARDQFAPYIQYPDHAPVNQWRDLNKSRDWSTFFLWRDGTAFEDNIARCPATAAAMRAAPLCDQPGFAPTVMFSALAPHTHIPPHTGSSNARLIAHLALIIPEKCRYRVGAVETDWTPGKAFVFDDSIEHEARNDSDHLRVVLIFDVWNPLLSAAERALISAMMNASNDYRAA